VKLSVEKPGSPLEILEHHGVKGMKWGVRQRSQYAGQKAGKAAAGEVRKAGGGRREQRKAGRKAFSETARETSRTLRTENKAVRAERKAASTSRNFKQKFPTSASRTQEIHRARMQDQAMRLKAASETNPAKRDKLIKEWQESPDRAIALRTTRGEKVVLGVLAGALAIPTAGAAPAALAGYGGTTVAIRRGIERGQAKRARQ